MTKMVQFTRDMAPFVKGEKRAIPNDVLVAKLVADGDAEVIPSIFDKKTAAAPQARPTAQTYQTRKGR